MFKKLTKIGMLAGLMAVATGAFAQNDAKMEYPRYGFWSNWSIGLTGSYNWQIEQGPLFTGDNAATAFRNTGNAGMGILLEQKMNHVFGVRLRFNMPSFWEPMTDPVNYPLGYNTLNRYASLSLDVKLSLNDAFKGYDPNRRGSLYIFAGGGLGLSFNSTDANGDATTTYGRFGLLLDGGLGYSYRVCDHSTLFAEVEMDLDGDAPNPFGGARLHNAHGLATIGYMYNFGVTAVDRELIAQRALLTQENFDAMNGQVSALESQLSNAKASEQRLQNRVNQLENDLAKAKANKGDNAAADSLQNIINNIKSDQQMFYALPFSVLFDVNSSTVSETEATKLAAIAKVMKDNPNANFTLVGFCDYTGSDAYNMKLSQKRAEAVKKQLVNKYGIAEDRLTCDWKGKGVAYGDLKLSINRRVSFYRNIE